MRSVTRKRSCGTPPPPLWTWLHTSTCSYQSLPSGLKSKLRLQFKMKCLKRCSWADLRFDAAVHEVSSEMKPGDVSRRRPAAGTDRIKAHISTQTQCGTIWLPFKSGRGSSWTSFLRSFILCVQHLHSYTSILRFLIRIFNIIICP